MNSRNVVGSVIFVVYIYEKMDSPLLDYPFFHIYRIFTDYLIFLKHPYYFLIMLTHLCFE